MPLDREKHDRRSIRFADHNYSRGGIYFVTITALDRVPLFGEIIDNVMIPNAFGLVIEEEWLRSAEIRRELRFDGFVLMPNHLHGIVIISPLDDRPPSDGGCTSRVPLQREPRSLSSFVAGFKSTTTWRINTLRNSPGDKVWQRNYHEHLIRSRRSHDTIREYIATNPQRWHTDQENPDHSLQLDGR